jgi:hypothetical protein
MTPLDTVYEAFLSKILDDEWENWDEEDIKQDLFSLLQIAIARFKFPRVSLDCTAEGFTEDLTNDEVQILATYMKCEWLNRNILTWENVKPLYSERDFSQANLIDKFNKMLTAEQSRAKVLEANYYRSVNKKPFDYTRLAQQSND